MKFLSLLRVETGRQLCSPVSWLIMAAAVLAPTAGYTIYRPAAGDSMATLYLANPMLAGGLLGSVLFAVCMVLSLERPKRSGVSSLTGTLVSPPVMNAVRMAAVLILAVLASLAVGLVYLPYTFHKLNIVFSWTDYALAVWLIYLSGPVMGTAVSCIIYQAAERMDVCLVAVLAFLIYSRTIRAGEFLWQWSVPLVPALSDAFGSSLVWRTALYSRFVWLCISGGLWGLSLLCVRQYGKGAAGSFLWQFAHHAWKPCIAVLMIAAGCFLWQLQPFVDHSPDNWMTAEEEDRYNDQITLLKTDLELRIDSYLFGMLSGKAVFRLKNLSGQPQDLYLDLNPGYQIRSLKANGIPLFWDDLKNDFVAGRELRCTLPADQEITLEICYKGIPRIWNAREELLDGSVISAQNIELSSMHMAPVLRNSVNIDENAPASMRVSLRNGLTMVTSGSTTMEKDNGDGTCRWRADAAGTDRFQMFAGDYVEQDLEGGGMPVEFYYSRKYQKRLEEMGAVDMMEQVIRYCTSHYGPRTFTEEEPFKIIQMTVFSFGGFAGNNISGMGETYFSDQNLNDMEKGADSAQVLAHEIVHQWWGLGASLMDPEDIYWSDEGITTYTTYRIMCELMGKEYADKNYVEKWIEEMEDNKKNFYLRHPEYLDQLPDSYANEIRAVCRSVNWYSGNALMMYRASGLVGEDAVDQVWSDLYLKSKNQEIPYITQDDFINACGLDREVIGRE